PFRFLAVPRVPTTRAPGRSAALVGLCHAPDDPFVGEWHHRWLGQIECIELVPCRMVLRLEQGIEVPERGENEVPLDFREAHAEEDPPDPLDVGSEDVPFPRPDQGRERLRVVPPEVDAPPLAGPEQVRRRLGHFLLQLDPCGEDLLPGRGEGDLPPDGFPLLHQLAPGLQIPQDVRIDRVLGQLPFREPGEENLIGAFRLRGRAPRGSDDDETAVCSLRHVRPTLPTKPSQRDGELGVIKLAGGLETRHLDPTARLDHRRERFPLGQLAPRDLGPCEPVRMHDPLFHRDQAFRLKPRGGVHDLDELAELAGGTDLLGRRFLKLAEGQQDLLLEVAQLHRTGRHPRRMGPSRYMYCRAAADSLPVTGFLSPENYDTSYILQNGTSSGPVNQPTPSNARARAPTEVT